jgi:hypothetical protein
MMIFTRQEYIIVKDGQVVIKGKGKGLSLVQRKKEE